MQRLGGAWLPRVLVLPAKSSSVIQVSSRHQIHRSVRNRSGPLRSYYRIFEASTLVLDLDAEDSPYVRPYNKDVDGIPLPNKNHELERRVADFEASSRNYAQCSKLVVSEKFNPWQISDHDILSIALGDLSEMSRAQYPSASPGTNDHTEETNEVIFNWNGIPHHVRNSPHKTISYMRRRQQLTHRANADTNDEKSLNEALNKSTSFTEFERLITNAIKTPQGRQLLDKCHTVLGRKCDELARKAPASMLPFLNNLIINLGSEGSFTSDTVVWYAFRCSLQNRVLSMTQKYLGILLADNRKNFNKRAAFTLETLKESIASPYYQVDIETPIEADSVHQLLVIYSILTGQTLGENTRQPSLNDIIRKFNGPNVATYLACLVQLGAFRTIWHIWHMPEVNACISYLISMANANRNATEAPNAEAIPKDKNDVFKALAFGNAIHQAIEANSPLVKLAENSDFTLATGQYNEDCQLDMEAIVKSADIISVPEGGQRTQTREVQMDEIHEIFSKDSIGESMLALQSYLSRVPTPESG